MNRDAAIRDAAVAAVAEAMHQEYAKGREDGLRVAEKICAWIGDVQPPRKYGLLVKEWGTKEIERARKALEDRKGN